MNRPKRKICKPKQFPIVSVSSHEEKDIQRAIKLSLQPHSSVTCPISLSPSVSSPSSKLIPCTSSSLQTSDAPSSSSELIPSVSSSLPTTSNLLPTIDASQYPTRRIEQPKQVISTSDLPSSPYAASSSATLPTNFIQLTKSQTDRIERNRENAAKIREERSVAANSVHTMSSTISTLSSSAQSSSASATTSRSATSEIDTLPTVQTSDNVMVSLFGESLNRNQNSNETDEWYSRWLRVVRLSRKQYDLPNGAAAREFVDTLTEEVNNLAIGVYRSERILVFMAVILQKDLHVKKAVDIR